MLLRIYSIGKKMMEEYKDITNGALKAKKSLRKELDEEGLLFVYI